MQQGKPGVNVGSDSTVCRYELNSCMVSLEPSHILTLERESKMKEGRGVCSQQSRSHAKLVQVTDSFPSLEHGSSVRSDCCLRTPEGVGTSNEEVGLPTNSSAERAQIIT